MDFTAGVALFELPPETLVHLRKTCSEIRGNIATIFSNKYYWKKHFFDFCEKLHQGQFSDIAKSQFSDIAKSQFSDIAKSPDDTELVDFDWRLAYNSICAYIKKHDPILITSAIVWKYIPENMLPTADLIKCPVVDDVALLELMLTRIIDNMEQVRESRWRAIKLYVILLSNWTSESIIRGNNHCAMVLINQVIKMKGNVDKKDFMKNAAFEAAMVNNLEILKFICNLPVKIGRINLQEFTDVACEKLTVESIMMLNDRGVITPLEPGSGYVVDRHNGLSFTAADFLKLFSSSIFNRNLIKGYTVRKIVETAANNHENDALYKIMCLDTVTLELNFLCTEIFFSDAFGDDARFITYLYENDEHIEFYLEQIKKVSGQQMLVCMVENHPVGTREERVSAATGRLSAESLLRLYRGFY